MSTYLASLCRDLKLVLDLLDLELTADCRAKLNTHAMTLMAKIADYERN